MNILITGSRGFIGSHLKKKLESAGHEIIEWDHKIDKAIENFELGSAEYVIHLAAWADVRKSIEEPQLYWDNNITNTTKIQKLCYNASVPLIYASSSCVHEWHKSPYGISKKVNEETAYIGQTGLRFTTVYGGEGAGRGMFMDKLKDRSLEYVTNHTRDFVHIDDVINAIILLMDQPFQYSLNPAYDIGTGKGYVVSELAQEGGYAVEPAEGDECEALDNTADISEIKKLGWEPTIDVLEYIRAL